MPASIEAISPFFVVSNIGRSVDFYQAKLGFEVSFQEPQQKPFFAVLVRDGVQIMVKSHEGLTAIPNSSRHPYMRWDAFVFTSEPDELAVELIERGAVFSVPLADTSEGLRGFELVDPDGYVLFFGRPQ